MNGDMLFKRKDILIVTILTLVVGVPVASSIGYTAYDSYFVNVDTYADAAYAEMWYSDYTGVALSFVAPNTYYSLFFNESHLEDSFTFEGGVGQPSNLTVGTAGTYLAVFDAIGSGQNNHEYHTAVFINEIEQNRCESIHKMSAGGDIITQSGSCHIHLDVGDKVSLRTSDYASTGAGVYHGGSLTLVRIA